MIFSRAITEAAKQDARDRYPEESCGIIIGDAYLPCANLAVDPTKDFQIAQSVTQQHIMDGTLLGVIHSHPTEQLKMVSCPSEEDMIAQVATNVPWGIVDLDKETTNDPYFWGDFLLDQPFIGNSFHHGVYDCYTVIRQWYWQERQIKLIEMPRRDLWWVGDDAEDLYSVGFRKGGFEKITKEELTNGDIILGKLRSDKINHAGLYLDNLKDGQGLVLHHVYGRLSRKESAYPYLSRAELFLRYTGNVA